MVISVIWSDLSELRLAIAKLLSCGNAITPIESRRHFSGERSGTVDNSEDFTQDLASGHCASIVSAAIAVTPVGAPVQPQPRRVAPAPPEA